jgi:cytochrome P450
MSRRNERARRALDSQGVALPPGPHSPSVVNTVRFARRPLDMLRRWHARYGDMFTIKLAGFGTGVYVVDPEAIRLLFTGDQSDLRAGEANSFLTPVLGPHSVLVLDGPEHLRQRKLLLPPFQGSRVTGFREVIREVAEREVASWEPGGRLVLRERSLALKFDGRSGYRDASGCRRMRLTRRALQKRPTRRVRVRTTRCN